VGQIVRNVVAVVVGVAAGSVVNMGLVMVSGQVIAPPAGADVTTMEGLRSSLHLFEPRHFLFPFLAHALGTLAGAVVAARLASTRRAALALVVGLVFLAGGVANTLMLPSPLWFTLADLFGAYIPMAWIGGRLGAPRSPAPPLARTAGV
jgi:hypothetical protein